MASRRQLRWQGPIQCIVERQLTAINVHLACRARARALKTCLPHACILAHTCSHPPPPCHRRCCASMGSMHTPRRHRRMPRARHVCICMCCAHAPAQRALSCSCSSNRLCCVRQGSCRPLWATRVMRCVNVRVGTARLRRRCSSPSHRFSNPHFQKGDRFGCWGCCRPRAVLTLFKGGLLFGQQPNRPRRQAHRASG